MTREEAIRQISEYIYCCDDSALSVEAGEMAIKALRFTEVIEDIKAEIIHYNDKHCNSEFISVGTVFEIIDRHIGKESR